jgi:DNA-binding SARP family transcriptional activator
MQDTMTRPGVVARAQQAWRLNVLGPVELCYESSPVAVTGIARDLLALLARTPGQEVSTTGVIASLWGGRPPDDAQNIVASQVSRLRKALTAVAPDVDPTSVVVATPVGYILHIGVSNVDAEAFELLLADGRRALAVGQPALAVGRLDAALKLWRGAAYADFGDQPFTRVEAQRLEELRLAAIESRVEARLALAAPGVPAELIGEVQGLLLEHWHRERLWVHLMTALYRRGRRSDALSALRRAERRLVEDLSIKPGTELRAAERAVLSDDPSLFGIALKASIPPAPLSAREPACIGREQEVDWLIAALDMAATRRAQARLVVGSPGIGKTRVVVEVAQRVAERGVAIRYGRGDPGSPDSVRDALVAEPDRLNLIVLDDLDLAPTEDVLEVIRFIRSHVDRPVLTLPTCRDPVRVGELSSLPKLVLTALGEAAVGEIVRIYAPATTDTVAVAAMTNACGVPGRLHRAASEWAFNRAGRRIDRAAASVAEPSQRLVSLREEIVGGVIELDQVRRSTLPLRPAARPFAGCPYRGLARYESADAELFRGREQAVAEVVSRLVDTPVLAIIGPAGSGKSSLVRAGVLPAIAGGVLPDSGRWRQLLVTPSAAAELALRLAQELDEDPADGPDPADATELAALADVADFDGAAVNEPTAELKQIPPSDNESPVDSRPRRTLLVVDQFEEVFTLVPAARAELFATLSEAAASDSVTVVVVTRSDAYPRLAEYPELGRLAAANALLLTPMTSEELRRAIEEPAAMAGVTVEPPLVDALVADAPTAGLPAFSAGLTALWGDLRLEAYRSGGGLGQAVEDFGERAYAALTPAQRTLAEEILVSLSDPGATPMWPRDGDRATVVALLREFGLVSIVDGRLALAHQSLVEGWPRLRSWIAERVVERDLRSHLRASARAWAEQRRPPAMLYGAVRLAAALDYAAGHELAPEERDFLAAGQRVLLAADVGRRRQVSRLWYVIIALGLTLATALAAGVMVFVAWKSATRANEQADAVRIAERATVEPDLRQALRLATVAATLDPSTSTVDALRATLLRSPDLEATAGDGVRVVAVSPDSHTVAAGTASGSVLLLRGGSLSPIGRLELPAGGAVLGLAFTPDGRRLVGWSAGTGGIVVWSVASGDIDAAPFGEPGPGAVGGLLADGDTLILAQPAATPVAWSISARTPSTTYELPQAKSSALLLAPDGTAVAAGSDGVTTVISLPSGHTTVARGAARPIALGPAGRTLLAADGTLWASGTRAGAIPATDVLTAAWSADGTSLATGASDGTIVVYDTRTLAATRTFVGDRKPVATIQFGPDGRTLYASGDSGGVMAWDLTGTLGARGMLMTADSEHLIAQACLLAGRDLSPQEWAADIPGYPYRRICPN